MDENTLKPKPGDGTEVEPEPDQGEEVEREIGELTENLAAERPPAAPEPKPEKSPSFWRSWPVALVVLLISIVMTVLNLAGLGPYNREPEPPTPAEMRQTSELELLALVGYIEDHRSEHGRLPTTLDELEIDLGGAVAEYERVDEVDFVVSISRGPVRRSFDSRLDTDESPAPVE